MDNVDGSDHYITETREPPPSLLNVIIDTNPHAWSLLSSTLSLARAVANLEVFINAHLATNHANRVTVIASHLQRASFLYPSPSSRLAASSSSSSLDYANFYRPFADLKATLDGSLAALVADTSAGAVRQTHGTALAGALSLALTYTNKLETALNEEAGAGGATGMEGAKGSVLESQTALSSRIVLLSVSAPAANQYIPLMNTVFAAQRRRIPIDVLSIPLPGLGQSAGTDKAEAAGDPAASFLQQAADATNGVFMPLANAHGLLQTLLMAFLPSGPSREMLIMPTTQGVDFRAACFCHQNTVDVGYVCSVCLSIFCCPPHGDECLTCGTPLRLGGEGWAKRPAVLPKRKKKKRKREGEEGEAAGK